MNSIFVYCGRLLHYRCDAVFGTGCGTGRNTGRGQRTGVFGGPGDGDAGGCAVRRVVVQ